MIWFHLKKDVVKLWGYKIKNSLFYTANSSEYFPFIIHTRRELLSWDFDEKFYEGFIKWLSEDKPKIKKLDYVKLYYRGLEYRAISDKEDIKDILFEVIDLILKFGTLPYVFNLVLFLSLQIENFTSQEKDILFKFYKKFKNEYKVDTKDSNAYNTAIHKLISKSEFEEFFIRDFCSSNQEYRKLDDTQKEKIIKNIVNEIKTLHTEIYVSRVNDYVYSSYYINERTEFKVFYPSTKLRYLYKKFYNKINPINTNTLQLATLYTSRGMVNYSLGKYEESIKDYDEAAKIMPNDFNILINRGISKLKLHLYREALDDCDKALSINSKSIEAQNIINLITSKLKPIINTINKDNNLSLLNTNKKDIDYNLSINKIPTLKQICIHEDLNGLLWFADGPYENYIKKENNKFINLSLWKSEEPSLIYTGMKVIFPKDIENVPIPPYYPSYKELTPQQKGVYMKLLQNPYDTSIHIGYVFLLYYGLERYLLTDKWKEAMNIIIKLRNVHSHLSFQIYTANALILGSILTKNGEMALNFIKSTNNKIPDFRFIENIMLLCFYSFEIPLYPIDIIKLIRVFDFNNNKYIKEYNTLFKSILETNIMKKYGRDNIALSDFFSEDQIRKTSHRELPVFANMSIRSIVVSVPMLTEIKHFKDAMLELLKTTHEQVKKDVVHIVKHIEKKENKLKYNKK